MPIAFNCSHCQAGHKIDDRYAGQVVSCPKCGANVTVPTMVGSGSGGKSRVLLVLLIVGGVSIPVLLCVVGILIALLLPAVQAARTAAQRTQDANNLKHIGLAFHNFHDAYKTLPAAYSVDAKGKPLLSWRVHILPFIDQEPLYRQFHLDEPWDSEHNRKLLENMPPIYRSPASKAPPGTTTYLAIGGDIFGKGGGCFRAPADNAPTWGKAGKVAGTSFGQITDGPSNTIFAVSASDQLAVEWTKPVEFKVDDMNPLKGLPGMYPRGFNAMFGDAGVHLLFDSIDKNVLKRLLDRKEGQPAPFPR